MRDIGYEPCPFQLRRQRRELVQHDASDAFAPQLFGNDEIEQANSAALDLHRKNCGEIADQLAHQTGMDFGRASILCGECADGGCIRGLDRANKELLAFHTGVNEAFTMRRSSSLKPAVFMRLQHNAIGQIILDNQSSPTTLPAVPPTSNKTILTRA